MNTLRNQASNRLIYIDILRIIASVAVVVIHVSAIGFDELQVNCLSWNICNIAESLSRFAVPVFVMISGCFFLDPDMSYSYRKVAKKIFRLIIAFLFWSLIYSVEAVFTSKSESLGSALYTFALNLFNGEYHLWFVFMIVGLYALSPILRKITAEKSITEYFLIITFVFTFCISFFEKVFNKLMGINVFLSFISEILTEAVSNFKLDFLSGYVFYFILGYYLNKYDLSKRKRKAIYLCGIISALIIIFGTYFLSFIQAEPIDSFYDYLGFPCCMVSVSIFLISKNVFSKIKLRETFVTGINSVSKLTFGIYLVHVLLIEILKNAFDISVNSFNAVVSVPVLSISIYLCSLFISYIISKIPFLNRYVI